MGIPWGCSVISCLRSSPSS